MPMLSQEKTGKLGKKRQQKQAAAARTGTEGPVAAESYRELSPTLADSSPATSSSPGNTVGSANRELTPAKAAGTGSGGPMGQLLGGCEGSDSGASSDTSLAAGFAGDQAPGAAGLGGDWEPLADTACTHVEAPVTPRAELALPNSSQHPSAPAAGPQHPSALPGTTHSGELNPMDGITGASLPAENLHSDTCISRDADTLTVNAGENTEFPEGQAAMQCCHPLLASGQPSSRGRRVCTYILFKGHTYCIGLCSSRQVDSTCQWKEHSTATLVPPMEVSCLGSLRQHLWAPRAGQGPHAYSRGLPHRSSLVSLHMQVRRRRQRRSPRQMAEAFTAGPAPDAKSAAAPSGAARSYPSTEDEEETSRLASQTGSRCVPGLIIEAVTK